MKFKQWLNESMSVYVADRSYQDDLNDIDDYIPIEPNLSPEQFEKNTRWGSMVTSYHNSRWKILYRWNTSY